MDRGHPATPDAGAGELSATVPEPLRPEELLASAVGALGAAGPKGPALVREVRQRAAERARDRLEALLSGKAPAPPRPRRAAVPRTIPRLEPDWPVEVRLPNGRKVRATFTPPVARRHDLAAVARVSAANDREAFATITRQGDALETLRRSHEELVKKVAVLQERADRALFALLQGLASFKQGLQAFKVRERAIRTERLSVRALAGRQQRELRSLATTARIQQVTAVVNSVQATAYGQRGSILATDNLLLAGNQLLWIFLDPLLRRVGMIEGASPSLATWLAPLGSLVTGHLALGNRQHVRFVSGIATFDGTNSFVSEPLRGRIAEGLWPKFQRRTDVPATAAPLDPLDVPITATVHEGVLRIDLGNGNGDGNPAGRVAWMVDTGADGG